MPEAYCLPTSLPGFATPERRERRTTTTTEPLGGRVGEAVRALLTVTPVSRLLVIGDGGILGEPVPVVAHLAVVTAEATPWPAAGPSVAIVAQPERLPFIEALFDQAVVANWTDGATLTGGVSSTGTALAAMLREIWRVLAPAGTLILAVPSRRAWPLARVGSSRSELTNALDAAMFEPLDWTKVDGCHVIHAAKRDGLAMVGRVTAASARPVTA